MFGVSTEGVGSSRANRANHANMIKVAVIGARIQAQHIAPRRIEHALCHAHRDLNRELLTGSDIRGDSHSHEFHVNRVSGLRVRVTGLRRRLGLGTGHLEFKEDPITKRGTLGITQLPRTLVRACTERRGDCPVHTQIGSVPGSSGGNSNQLRRTERIPAHKSQRITAAPCRPTRILHPPRLGDALPRGNHAAVGQGQVTDEGGGVEGGNGLWRGNTISRICTYWFVC